jgi:Na+-transporting NADH:ubiquinone oxidoreductase subunit NqrB
MLMNPSQTLIANRWLSVFLFIAIATLLSALVGWLVKKGVLPLKPMMAFSSATVAVHEGLGQGRSSRWGNFALGHVGGFLG